MRAKHQITTLMLIVASASVGLPAQPPQTQESAISWQTGPVVGKLGNLAQIQVPKGFRFTEKAGAQKLLELTQNIPNGTEVGALMPETTEPGHNWFLIFEFSEVGFVKDDEKDKLDANAILESLKEGTEKANEIRQEKGWPGFHVAGWERSPFYDTKTNNLNWAIRGRDDTGGGSINHSTRILGRRGTMNVDLVVDPEDYQAVMPAFEEVMAGFAFTQGHRYLDFVSGDKVASYGLTALVAGGVGVAMVKSGLLQKFWKLIIVGLIVAAAALKKLFATFFRRAEAPTHTPPR